MFLSIIKFIALLFVPRARENKKIAKTIKSEDFGKWIKFKTRDHKTRRALDTRVHNSVKDEFGKDSIVTKRLKLRALKKIYLSDKRKGLVKFD